MRSNPYRTALLLIWPLLGAIGIFFLFVGAGHARNGSSTSAAEASVFGTALLNGALIGLFVWLAVAAITRALADRAPQS